MTTTTTTHLPRPKNPVIMGIVNVTPDSFSDGGQFADTTKAVDHALQLMADGADILDIGGESTRPGAQEIAPQEEQKRILPVIEVLKKTGIAAKISVDTRHADTMQKAIDLGADIINDISALTHDINSLHVVSKAQIPVILMHMQGTPQTMQDKPEYHDVVGEVIAFLKERKQACMAAGIDEGNIIFDPGIGFGKSLEDNLAILNNIKKFNVVGCPVLLGTSRKSFIEKICANTPTAQRLPGSLASILWGLEQGVEMFRVHDVAQTRQAFDVWQAIKQPSS